MDGQKIEPAKVRAWALERGMTVGKRGRLHANLIKAYEQDMERRANDNN